MYGLREVHGLWNSVLVIELCTLAFLALTLSLRHGVQTLRISIAALSFGLSSFFFWLAAYGQAKSWGRPIDAVGLLMPGSLMTRAISLDLSLPLRRFVEPSWLFLLFTCVLLCQLANSKRGKLSFHWAKYAGILLLFTEAVFLLPGIVLSSKTLFLHVALTQIFILCLLAGLLSELFQSLRSSRVILPIEKVFVNPLLAYGLIAAVLMITAKLSAAVVSPQLGAHYYFWFPENWRGGYIGEKTNPAIRPALGEYSSDSVDVFRQHLRWGKDAGLDFFLFDWWPARRGLKDRVLKLLEAEPELGGLSFAVHYETQDLKEKGDKTFAGEEPNVVYMTEARARRLKLHFETLAKRVLNHPRYLKVNGKPVVFVYASRHLLGPVAEAFAEMRTHVYEKTGLELFLVGDEAYFNVLTYSPRHGLLLRRDGIPEWERLVAFDALSLYNPYDASRTEHAGIAGAERFLSDTEQLYAKYERYAATVGIPFAPVVLAGYNDRGLRLEEDHFVVPRWLPDGSSFLGRGIERLGLPFLNPAFPFLAITSWNEWNEGSQIEPSEKTAETNLDTSPDGQTYTQGETHRGYGEEYIEELVKY